jgi:hypothetical protein
MLKSAENFVAGFFGLEWTKNATIEVIIDERDFNNSLAGYNNCPNSNKDNRGSAASNKWIAKFLDKGTCCFHAHP